MFEQASIDTQGALTSPWALAISVTGQTLAVGAVILFSLIHTDVIRPPSFLAATLTVPTGSPPPPAHLEQRTVARTSNRTMNAFVAPSSPPAAIDMSPDDLPAPPAGDYFVGAIPTGSAPGGSGFLTSLFGDTIARPAPPVARVEPAPPKKADVVAPRKPIAVSTGVQAAKLVRQVKPVYPQLARSARISGVVRMVAIIGKDGSIQNLQVTAGHPLLTPAAVEAVKQWLYQPTLLNGEAVDVITQVEVNFTLSQ